MVEFDYTTCVKLTFILNYHGDMGFSSQSLWMRINDKTGYDSTVKGFKTYLRGVVSPLNLKNHKRYLRDDFNTTWYNVFGKIKISYLF